MIGNKATTAAYKAVQKIRSELHHAAFRQWKHDSLFTWEWWLLFGLTLIPVFLWWMILDKKRAYEIAFYGCMIDIMAIILDDIGTNLSWWGYPVKLLPIIPPLLTADSILVPIVLMLVYQWFSTTWRSHLITNLLAAGFLSFIAEPMFTWIGFYQLNEWKYLYSFIFYNLCTSLARLIIVRIIR